MSAFPRISNTITPSTEPVTSTPVRITGEGNTLSGPTRVVSGDHFVEAGGSGPTRLAGGTTGPVRISAGADLSTPENRTLIANAGDALRSASAALSETPPNYTAAREALAPAHAAIQSLTECDGTTTHPAVARLRQRYFEVLDTVSRSVPERSEELSTRGLTSFVAHASDGDITYRSADYIRSRMAEETEVRPMRAGTTLACESEGEPTVESSPGTATITTEPSEMCRVVPFAE